MIDGSAAATPSTITTHERFWCRYGCFSIYYGYEHWGIKALCGVVGDLLRFGSLGGCSERGKCAGAKSSPSLHPNSSGIVVHGLGTGLGYDHMNVWDGVLIDGPWVLRWMKDLLMKGVGCELG